MKVCGNCFNDLEIKNFIESTSNELGSCDYCNTPANFILSLEELLDFFSEFIDVFVLDDEIGTPILNLIKNDWEMFSSETNSNELLNDILSQIDSTIKLATTTVCYKEEIVDCIDYWEILKDDLKWKRRFLSDIETIFDLGWDTYFNSTTDMSKDKILYRARIHNQENLGAYNSNEMGTPLKEYATNGRANPDGIPYLYLSENYETTLYETRVTYLDEVSVGDFKLVEGEELLLVDFTDYRSPFLDMGNIIENAKSRLLQKKISFDLSKPIRRYDSQLEYLPTQFICEFIRYINSADGIVFDSSLHKGGINYVIFSDKKFECIKVQKYHVTTINIEASTEDEFLPKFDG